MMNIALAFVTSLVITALSGLVIIPWLRKLKMGQTILEDGPVWHKSKQGTTVMGGLTFGLGTTVATLLFSIPYFKKGDLTGLLVLIPAVAFGAIGAFDDLVKVTKKRNKGLTALQKLILQVAVAVLFVVALQYTRSITGMVPIPFTKLTLQLPWLLFVILAAIFVTGTDNATNLTDGIDGLLAGTALPPAVFFALACTLRFDGVNASVAVPAAALAGGLVGFLIYNYHPAKVFMGDTGSLFIGGLLSTMSLAVGNPLLLVVIGLFFYWETFSVMLQVGYFKLTHGKRIFKMAPFHHHLEMCGWNEYKIFWTFTIFHAVMCLLAWLAI